MTGELEKRRQEWYNYGKKTEEVPYGMLNEGFRSLQGIPDDFCSAEDPKDRIALWEERTNALENLPYWLRPRFIDPDNCPPSTD